MSFLSGEALPPGPIDNSALINEGCLNPEISLNLDFVMVSEQTWTNLLEIYGGGISPF
jgi:hypothetical protein